MCRKNTLILSFTLLVVMLGYGMVLPVMPLYIKLFGAGGSEMGWLMATYSLMQLICAPLWGVFSDRVGRKPVLALGVLGYALTLLLFGLSTQFWMIFAARTLAGILSSATMPTAMAYISDHVPEKERSGSMGTLGAAMGAGMVVGPLMGGVLSEQSLSVPFFVGAGMAFLAFWLVILILPESRTAAGDKGTRSRLTFGEALTTLRSPAGMVLLLILVMSFGMAGFQGIIGLYAVDKYQLDNQMVGVLWMVIGGVLILGQGVLTGPLTRRFGLPVLIRAGLAGGALGFLLMAFASSHLALLFSLVVFTLALAVMGPALNAYLSLFAGNSQGAMMGFNTAFASLGRVVGPLWAGPFYDISFDLPFFGGAVILALGMLLSFAVKRNG